MLPTYSRMGRLFRVKLVPIFAARDHLPVARFRFLPGLAPPAIAHVLLERMVPRIGAVDHDAARGGRFIGRAVVQKPGVEEHDRACRSDDFYAVFLPENIVYHLTVAMRRVGVF